MVTQRIDKNATIYNYTLVKKIRHRPEVMWLHLLTMVAIWAIGVSGAGFRTVWTSALGFVALQVVYAAVMLADATFLQERSREWTLTLRFPWFGLTPKAAVPLQVVKRVHAEFAAAGFVFAGALYPWLPLRSFAVLIILHVLCLVPQTVVIVRMARVREDGLIKLGERETSLYTY